MRYLDKDIEEINKLLKEKIITPRILVEEAFESIEKNYNLNHYITLNKEEALKQADELKDKEVDNILFGLPIAVKDNIITKGLRTTCASHILDNFIPIYDAKVVKKIKEKNMIIVGKTNMDEFAMGSTSKTSYFKTPKNPNNNEKVCGGSSGGSAGTVSANDLFLSLGTDTGGSIRQPAAYTGIVGMKPTYGRVSRNGLVAFASSLDQIGPMTKDVKTNALLLNAISGYDEKDLTSFDKEEDFTRLLNNKLENIKVAIPNFFMSDIVNEEIREKVKEIVKLLEKNNIVVDYIDMKFIDHAVTLYQIIAMGEASSNLARFDGIRYGTRSKNAKTIEEVYLKTRGEGFGKEVKRRIMVGSYLLSGENARKYYYKALSIRDDMKKEFNKVFEKYDYIIGPTTTTTAPLIKEESNDPSKSFLDDVLTIPVNMAGLPGLSLPIGKDKDNMPIGMQIIGNDYQEAKIYNLAYFIENKLKGENNE